jgi:hypothetical protein
VRGERLLVLLILALGSVACLLGLLVRPPSAATGVGAQLLDLIWVICTTALAISLLLGPGLAWRALGDPRRAPGLAFLPLPGIAMMVAAGALVWVLADQVDPRVVGFAAATPILGGVLGILIGSEPRRLLEPEEQRCLLVVGCVLGLAIGRALWSLGPEGELLAGTVSRTLEVGDRPDSRIPYHVTQVVANGAAPYGPLATELFSPYNFSSRGPLAGFASTPVVLLSGGRPPTGLPEQPWQPFDPQGFMAYRLAMMAFACTAFVALWDLTRRLAGAAAGRLALLLAATTPFLVHEVWFTWPKMLAAAFVLMAAICLIDKRPLGAGLLIGAGYLMHSMALLSLPILALIALWPLTGASLKKPRVRQLVLLGAGAGAWILAWRVANGAHFQQGEFLKYFTEAGTNFHPDPSIWIDFRLESVANTLVPMLLPFASADSAAISVVGATYPSSIHFFFQYWTTVPFGLAILLLPLLVVSLWRSLRRWPWAVTATVIVPFLLFAVYWGSSTSGMLREGLQTWVLTLFVVIGCEQAASHFGWLRSRPIRAILVLRILELLGMVLMPTLLTRHELIGEFALSDTVALAAIVGFAACLAWQVWSESPPRTEPVSGPSAARLACDGRPEYAGRSPRRG